LVVAGRTDRGVHALGQVVSYDGPLPLLRSVNAVLPDEIVVLSAEEAPDGFSARHDAVRRSYRYRVLARSAPSPFERGRALWYPYPLDEAALHACAAALPGVHDFTAFTPAGGYHTWFHRAIARAGWERRGDVLEFSIEADAFMRQMNRVSPTASAASTTSSRCSPDAPGRRPAGPRPPTACTSSPWRTRAGAS
jgi:tRNA pseudouridine38-40 synthase